VSVAYITPKSRTERPRKTKIGTEVAHVTCDSDITSSRSPGRFGWLYWQANMDIELAGQLLMYVPTRSSADADNRLDAFISGQSSP